jgi:hypothetical protein
MPFFRDSRPVTSLRKRPQALKLEVEDGCHSVVIVAEGGDSSHHHCAVLAMLVSWLLVSLTVTWWNAS